MATRREQLARKADELLNAQQERRLGELNAIERLLFRRLTLELAGMLEENNGRISSRKGPVTISKAIDAIFDAIQAKQIGKMTANIAGDMREVLTFNAAYYRVLAVNKGDAFKALQDRVNATMRKRLGIDPDGGVLRKGYLDTLFPTEASRNEVKALVQKSVAAGVPMRKLTKALSVKLIGTPNAAGVLEKNIGGFVLGAYRLADSVTNNEFGKRLDLKYFIYSGGLIETSRQFCKEKNNRVFTTEEALRDWPFDPNLPKSKAEKEAGGAPADYQPLEDLGRWEGKSERCRHRLLYISEEEAFRRRPELRPKVPKK